MLKDFEGNRIYLSENPNGHLLVLGRSGAGKTYFSCRKIEAAIKEGKSLYIFDHSCSYSLIELKKNRFRYADNMNILNPMEKRMEWNFSGKDIQKSLTNSLLRELRIRSYYQKNLLSKAIDNVFHEGDHFSIPQLIKHLNDLRYREEDEESAKNALHLLNHLDPYSEIGEISISQDNEAEKEGTLTLIQLSDYPEIQRKFLTEFLAELFWEEVRHGKKKADIVLFDEFQNMDLKPGSALSSMLREGRKFGLSVHLSTQFLGDHNKESVQTLTQAGNMVFFRPTEREMRNIARMIDPDHTKNWLSVLNRLKIGEAILKGNYTLNDNEKIITSPILCKVQEVRDI